MNTNPCADAASFRAPPGQRQLFVDDYGIAEVAGLRRTLHPLAKKGAVIRPDWTQGVNMLQVHATPIWDAETNRYRFWVYEWPDELYKQGIADLNGQQVSLRFTVRKGSLYSYWAEK